MISIKNIFILNFIIFYGRFSFLTFFYGRKIDISSRRSLSTEPFFIFLYSFGQKGGAGSNAAPVNLTYSLRDSGILTNRNLITGGVSSLIINNLNLCLWDWFDTKTVRLDYNISSYKKPSQNRLQIHLVSVISTFHFLLLFSLI